MTALLLTGLLIVLLVLGVPVAFSLGILSVGYFAYNDLEWAVLSQRITNGSDSFTLIAIPLFVLAGSIMNNGGVTKRLFDFANLLVGHIKGGLAHVNVVASVMFAGMTGSIAADVGGLGQIEIKAMRDRGFPAPFSAAVTASSALIGPIIPPSILFVIYGGLTGASIGALFIAGIVPGVVMAGFLMVCIYFLALKNRFPVEKRNSIGSIAKGFVSAFPSLLTPVIIIAGILGGVVTPTEAAVLACLYALVLSKIYGTFSVRELPKIMHEVVSLTAIVMFVLAVSNIFSWILIVERVGPSILSILTALSDNSLVIFFILVIVGIVLGLFLDASTILIIVMPIVLPILSFYEVDLIQFGVVFIISLAFGSVTPPVGLAMFIAAEIAKVSIIDFVKASWPFLVGLFLCIMLLMTVPALTLWLPGLLE